MRRERLETLEPGAWTDLDQDWLTEKAWKGAAIRQVTFDELRHTYASELVSASMPLKLIAASIGHSTTCMVEKESGHLAPDAVAHSIAKFQPRMLTPPKQVLQTAITFSGYALSRQPGPTIAVDLLARQASTFSKANDVARSEGAPINA